MNPPAPKRWIFTHHKCASAWSRGVFDHVAAALGLRYSVHDSFPHMRPDDEAGRAQVAFEYGQAAAAGIGFDANARSSCVDVLERIAPDFRAVHLVRDPRDVLVSVYFSHRDVHPTDAWPALATHRERLRALPVEQGLVEELDFAAFCLDAMATWNCEHPRILTLRYEDLFGGHGPRRGLELALVWLQLELPAATLDAILAEFDFAKLSGGRGQGEEDRAHHYRKGTAGDWQNHVTPTVEREFMARYGEALENIGYATSPAHGN